MVDCLKRRGSRRILSLKPLKSFNNAVCEIRFHEVCSFIEFPERNRADFYGLCKGKGIKFVIFFTPLHDGIYPMNQLVTNRIDD